MGTPGNPKVEPRASYFLLAAASSDGNLATAYDLMMSRTERAVASGAVVPLAERCTREHPRAALDDVTLPPDDGEALVICLFNAALLETLPASEGVTAKALVERLPRSGIMPDRTPFGDIEALFKRSMELGPPVRILRACDGRFN